MTPVVVSCCGLRGIKHSIYLWVRTYLLFQDLFRLITDLHVLTESGCRNQTFGIIQLALPYHFFRTPVHFPTAPESWGLHHQVLQSTLILSVTVFFSSSFSHRYSSSVCHLELPHLSQVLLSDYLLYLRVVSDLMDQGLCVFPYTADSE